MRGMRATSSAGEVTKNQHFPYVFLLPFITAFASRSTTPITGATDS